MTSRRGWVWVSLFSLAALGAVAACSSGGSSGGSGGAGGSAGTGTGGTAGSGGTAGAGGTSGSGGAAGSAGTGGGAGSFDCSAPSGAAPKLALASIASGFSKPLIAVSPPGDTDRLFVAEQPGVVRLIKSGSKVQTPVVDLTDRVRDVANEQGLLGMAFHPDFANNGRVFFHYTGNGQTGPSGATVITEITAASAGDDTWDKATEKVLLTQSQPEANHNGGSIEFGADGMLYIGLGDGGGAGDAHGSIGNGQSTDTLLGKILRIDVDGTPAAGKAYAIPSGNMSGAGVLPEIWSYGLRNPWRISFDACKGDLYIGDVGQNKIEEIDVGNASDGSGTNWGWRVMEGSECFNPATGCDKSGKALPAAEYDHSQGCSVTGGYVYRGSAIPGLRGTYLYADFCSGRFWWFQWNGTSAVGAAEITSDINPGTAVKNISSFGQDAKGELYVTSFDGNVYRIVAQ